MEIEENGQFKFDLDKEKAIVVQGNSFAIARYDMSNMEQKLFLILLSTISKNDDCFIKTNFKVKDLAEIMEIHPNVLYRDLKKICKSLMSKVYEVPSKSSDWELVNLFSYAKYEGKYGTVSFKLNLDAKPYLLQLKEYFYQFKLQNALVLDGKYSIRIYQQAKSKINLTKYIMSIEDFTQSLKLTQKSYKRFSNIKAKVLDPAIEEINLKTDIIVKYEEIRVGRSIHSLKFYVKPNSQLKVATKNNKSKTKIGFNNFESRKYNNDALEKALLGWDDNITIEDIVGKR